MKAKVIENKNNEVITNFVELENKIKDIDYNNMSIKYMCSREFECMCVDISKLIDVTNISTQDIIDKINSELEKGGEENRKKAFVILFIFASKYRRNKILGGFELVSTFSTYFADIPMYDFCYLLAKYSEYNNSASIKNIIGEVKGLLTTEEFKDEIGVKNFYCELVATYYEHELEKRDDYEAQLELKNAYKTISLCIDLSKKKAYDKFYANRGRILILLKKYDEGEREIRKALSTVNATDAESTTRVILFENYLIQSSSIRYYDLNNEKYNELNKIKINNFKIITLMTTLLSFILGSINIFSTISEPFLMAMLLVAFLGLILTLCGIILFGLGLVFKDNKKKYVIYDLIVLSIGIIFFTAALCCLILIK